MALVYGASTPRNDPHSRYFLVKEKSNLPNLNTLFVVLQQKLIPPLLIAEKFADKSALAGLFAIDFSRQSSTSQNNQ